jgi:hypothetical protein
MDRDGIGTGRATATKGFYKTLELNPKTNY